MMKKFVVLMLVLGMASLASAGLDVTIDGTKQTTASWSGQSIESTGTLRIDAELATAGVQYQLQVDVSGTDIAIDYSGVNFPGVGTFWLFGNTFLGTPDATSAIMTGGGFSPNAAGTAAFDSLNITGTAGTIVLTETFDDFSTQVSTVTVTPEPMTMVLLGLGGLFLRRRK